MTKRVKLYLANLNEIYKNLKISKDFYDIEIFDSLESTNTTLKNLAKTNIPEGKVIIAKEQTGGRGKMNRSFFSPKASGIYMSILLKPDLPPDKAMYMTALSSVAVSEAIEAVSGNSAKIKWVNDIYCKGLKVCGILTESGFGLYSDKIGYAVVGIGINLKEAEGGFPSDISHIAGAVFKENEYSDKKKNLIIAEVLERVYSYYQELEEKTFAGEYKSRSNLIGEEVDVVFLNETKRAHVLDIDDDLRLVVEYNDGTKEAVISADVFKIIRA